MFDLFRLGFDRKLGGLDQHAENRGVVIHFPFLRGLASQLRGKPHDLDHFFLRYAAERKQPHHGRAFGEPTRYRVGA